MLCGRAIKKVKKRTLPLFERNVGFGGLVVVPNTLINFFLKHPFVVDIVKGILSSKMIANNKIYQRYILKKADLYASEHPYGEMGVAIETTVNCNARCIMCGQSSKEMQGTMEMDLYKKIIKDCKENNITTIGLSVYGEPLMDKHFFERIRYLREYDMNYGFFTNGSLLNSDKAQMLFKLGGLSKINFSVCGYEKDVYENVMIGLKRDTTYKNILNFLDLKQKSKEGGPCVGISTVKTNRNKKDIPKFVKFWKHQRGVDYIITADLWDRVGDKDVGKIGNIDKLWQPGRWLPPCKELWGSIYIYFDGRVAPCCVDNDNRELIVGNMHKQTLKEIYTSDIMKSLRGLHLSNKRHTHKVCGSCFRYSVWF